MTEQLVLDPSAPTEHEARIEREAEEAAQRIQRGNHWLDWLAVGDGLLLGRRIAMRRAYTNEPVGRGYNQAFSQWMDEHPWAADFDKATGMGFNKATRNHALWAAEHRTEIERWREGLPANVRERMNHPTTVWRAYKAAHRTPAETIAEKGASKSEKLQAEVVRLEEENYALKKQAAKGVDGSLFDLKQDRLEDIVRTICDTLIGTPTRLQRLGKLLNTAIGERMKKPAG